MQKRNIYSLVILLTLLFIPIQHAHGTSNIVNPNQIYTYEEMTTDIKKLSEHYPDIISYKSIGQTAYGRELWAIKLGNGPASIFINGSHHGREWLTTNLNMNMIETYAQAYTNNAQIDSYNVHTLLDKTSIWFVPMVNPDGVTLQQQGLSAFPKSSHTTLIKMNNGSKDFKRWKANAKGIDLNRQYPANWENIRNFPNQASWAGFKGTTPFEAEETIALKEFTYSINPEIAVSYHSSGRILFWYHETKPENLSRDKSLATKFSKITNYELVLPKTNTTNYGGGYTDWFISEFGKPAFTPEISYYVGHTNVPLEVYPEVWNRNKLVGLWLADEGLSLWYDKHKEVYESIQLIKHEYNAKKVVLTEENSEEVRTLKNSLIANYIQLHDYKKASEVQFDYMKLTPITDLEISTLSDILAEIENKNLHLFIGRENIKFAHQPFSENNVWFVPTREIAEHLNLQITWNAEERAILLKGSNALEIVLKGNNAVVLNNDKLHLKNINMKISNGVSYVPISFFIESLNLSTNWYPESQIYQIKKDD